MTNKLKPTAMTKDSKPTLTAKLRFPEFYGQTAREVKLKDVTAESTSRNGKTLPAKAVMGVSKVDGIVPMEERIVSSDIARYKIVQKDWFAYNPMRLNIGSIARWQGESDILVSPDYVVFRCLDEAELGLHPAFMDQFRRSVVWEDFVKQRGDGSVRVRIYYKDIGRLPLTLPKMAEQQKIADCLTSVDELIAAQARKVDSLKTHKKGLMQHLFPGEGKAQSRLRFPEFQDTGEWGSDTLGSTFDTSSGGTPDRAKQEFWNGSIPWITTSLVDFNFIKEADEFITEAGLSNSSAKLFPEKTILVAMYGQGKTRGQVAMLGITAATNQACAAILPRKDIDPCFVFQYLISRYDEMRRLSNSGGQENLSQGLLQELQFSYPKDEREQQRIADCLTSLDDIIAAQTQKLDALKTHKKGLMQLLFPCPEEAGA